MCTGPGNIGHNKDFMLFSVSQAAASAGDAFQAVASALLLVDITGSGLNAGLAVIFLPLCGVMASVFAGLLGDNQSEKRLLIAFGIAKCMLLLLFTFVKTAWACYALLFLLALANVFYGVPSRKIVSALLPAERLLEGNSVLNGLSGVVFFIGPVLAGVLSEALGIGSALLAGACFHALSTALLAALPQAKARRPASWLISGNPRESLRNVAAYCLQNKAIRSATLTFCVLSLASSATSLTFYPYAFDMLRVSSAQWGVIVSVYNGATLLSSAFPLIAAGRFGKSYDVPICICCLFVADAWFSYGLCGSFAGVLPLLAVEGTAYFLGVTLLATRLQLLSGRDRMARVLGLNDLAVNASRLIGMGAAAAMLPLGPVAVFAACGCMLAVYALAGLTRVIMKKKAGAIG